ncbi:MAG TPA: hypothetical protein VF763_07170 [Candidatus Limnocylindrales bacterium]
MAAGDFPDELRAMGLEVTADGGDRIRLSYEVPVGPRIGERIVLGFVLPPDYPASPPSGPHVSPPMFALASGGSHPSGGIHASPFGDGFQYWSRPHPDWARTSRTARDYMAFIRQLFATL